MKIQYTVSAKCLENLLKKEKEREFDRLVKSNKSITVEQCFEQNQRMILKYKEA